MGKSKKGYKRIVWAAAFPLVLLMGIWGGCAEQESKLLEEKQMEKCFTEGELSWEQGFDWIYHAYAEGVEREPEKTMQACTGEEAEWKAEGYFAVNRHPEAPSVGGQEEGEAQNRYPMAGKVEVMCSFMSQEALLTHIDALAERLFLHYTRVSCVIVGDAAIAQLVRVDAGEEHWLYLQQEETVYALYCFADAESWQVFLEGWLLSAELSWGGKSVCGSRNSIPADDSEAEGLRKKFFYKEFSFYLSDSRLLSCQHDEEGFFLKLGRGSGTGEGSGETRSGEETGSRTETAACEFWLRPEENLPDCETEADYLAYFLENYPTMSYYFVDPKNKEPNEEADDDNVWRQIEDSKGKYAFFNRDGVLYTAGILGEDFIGAVGRLYWQSDYGEQLSRLHWQKDENGDIYCRDMSESFFEYIEREVNGERLCITTQDIDDREERQDEEIFDKMEVSIRKGDEDTPFQVFCIWKCPSPYAWESYFEDINADGYQDLVIVNTSAASNLNAGTFLWLPSEGRFSEDTGVLDFYSGYDVDKVNRRIHVRTHGSAVIGSCTTYQWTGESGLEKIKYFSYIGGYNDMMEVHVSRYENGREEVWIDCAYTMEEYNELYREINNSYEWDCVWEQEVTNERTGKKFILRYLELLSDEYTYDMDGYYSYYHDGGLFVFDEDTRLISVSYSELISGVSSITMGNLRDYFHLTEYDEEGLIVQYEDGGVMGIPWANLIGE